MSGVRIGLLAAAVGGAAIVATVGTIGSWPPIAGASEPTAADKLADLKHLGIGADGLLAAGLTVNQAMGVLDWIGEDRVRFTALRAASLEITSAQSIVDSIRAEMVRAGRTEDLDIAYASAQSQIGSARTAYDSLVAQAQTALGTLITEELNGESAWPGVSLVIENRDRRVPAAFKVLELSSNEWEHLERYHALYEKQPEAVSASVVAFAESLALDSAVANAQDRVNSGGPMLIQALLIQ